ncbi:MAG: ribonuclease Z [Candidatus Woesearchaeota archaeon]|jgi:ribonuclease Z
MVPTKDRNVSGIYLEEKGVGILFDCGEGTQRQMNFAGISRNKVRHLFISHWHADHVAGILGLLQTIGDKGQAKTIDIYGPTETKIRVQHLIDATYFDQGIQINVHDIEKTKKVTSVLKTDDFEIQTISLDHTIPCLGYTFKQNDRRKIKTSEIKKRGISPGPILKQFQSGETVEVDGKKVAADDVTTVVVGKKFTYVADTGFTQNAITLAKNADLVIAESSYTKEHTENALKFKHLTSEQTATIAKEAEAQMLVLTHISQRYKKTTDMLKEAKAVFTNTVVGKDFQEYTL